MEELNDRHNNMCHIRIVIGSWGSYNACNQRALGSSWLDLDRYNTWNEIAEELTRQGFDLKGLDEELFIQDIEGLPSDSTNWDYASPKELFETLQISGVLGNENKYDIMLAYLEIRSFTEFENAVKQHGENWDEDIYLYKGYDWDDFGREVFNNQCYQIEEHLLDFFDFEAYGRYMGDYAEEYSDGIIEISR